MESSIFMLDRIEFFRQMFEIVLGEFRINERISKISHLLHGCIDSSCCGVTLQNTVRLGWQLRIHDRTSCVLLRPYTCLMMAYGRCLTSENILAI